MINQGTIRLIISRSLVIKCHQCNSYSTAINPSRMTFEEVQIPVPWGYVAGKWWGDRNVQPLLGLHGWEDNASTFDNLAPMLNIPSFLAVDLFGHGMSSYYPEGSMPHFMDTIVFIKRIVNHFKWNKVSLIGHSMGSAMAFLYSSLYPDGVDNYVSIDCARTLMMKDEKLEKQIRDTLDRTLSIEKRMLSDPPSYSFEKLIDMVHVGSGKSLTKESSEVLLKRGIKTSLHDSSKYYLSRDPRVKPAWLGRMSKEYILACAPRIQCNVLSIRGKGGFLFGGIAEEVYFDSIELMKQSAAHLEHYDVEGSHHLHLNNPENVAPLINKFFLKAKY